MSIRDLPYTRRWTASPYSLHLATHCPHSCLSVRLLCSPPRLSLSCALNRCSASRTHGLRLSCTSVSGCSCCIVRARGAVEPPTLRKADISPSQPRAILQADALHQHAVSGQVCWPSPQDPEGFTFLVSLPDDAQTGRACGVRWRAPVQRWLDHLCSKGSLVTGAAGTPTGQYRTSNCRLWQPYL